MLEASGDTQGARREFERALEISRSMGATGYVERITKKLHGVQQLDSISLKPSNS